ncbi:MAG: hypothetical protein QOF16_992, partial [Actinomycetota bacterium]|nr:hypothetical protein [Actinomycetota bacterium]
EDEIAKLAATMNAMLDRLEVARDKQQRLVSDAAHELRNPIASIRHHAEVALAHPDKTEVSEVIAEILAEDLRLQRLTEDLLLLARMDEGALELGIHPVDIDDLVLTEAKRLKQTTRLKVDTSQVTAARTQGDPGQLQRVVRNLAENAANHAASSVRFSVHETDGRVRLEVEDDGPGIPVEKRDVVFERFTRLDDARDRGHGGSGLGLAIVKEIVSMHGGETQVGDASIGGARFRVVLPSHA